MATLRSVQASTTAPRKAVHAGMNSESVIYSLAAALSVGDQLQLIKIPSGAVIQDVSINWQISGSITASVGDTSSTARFAVSMSATLGCVVGGVTYNTVWRASSGVPYSYSADDILCIYPTTVTTGTVSGWVGVTVTYCMDNGSGGLGG